MSSLTFNHNAPCVVKRARFGNIMAGSSVIRQSKTILIAALNHKAPRAVKRAGRIDEYGQIIWHKAIKNDCGAIQLSGRGWIKWIKMRRLGSSAIKTPR